MSKRPLVLYDKMRNKSVLAMEGIWAGRTFYTDSEWLMSLAVWHGYSVKRFNPGIYKLTTG